MRRKLLLSFIVLIVVLMTAFVFIINKSMSETIESQYAIHFKYELNLIETIIKNDSTILADPKNYIAQAALGEEARITIIDRSGVVLADSFDVPENVSNHLNRPEIQQIIAGVDYGNAVRMSATFNKNFIYVAKRVQLADDYIYVRLAEPLTDIDDLNRNNIRVAIFLGVLASIVTAVIGWLISQRIAQPINELIQSADLIARGQYNKKIYVSGSDEVARLANSFNTMRTNLSQTMNALTTRNAELGAIINSMASGMIAVDGNENIILINQQCFDILSLPDSAVSLHDSVYKVVKNQRIVDLIRASTAGGESSVEEVMHPHIDKILRVHVQPIRIDAGDVMGTMIVIDDITQIRRLEGIRSEFVSNVTHELKTPLTSILGFIDTLKGGAIEQGDKARRFLTIIETEAERLNRLINDILVLSEIENTQVEKERHPIELGDVIQEVVDMLAINIGNKDIVLKFVTNHSVRLLANRDRIKQLLINLIDNAIKYTEEGYVHIHLTHTQDYARIAVEDTGMGFDNTQKLRLFERFYRIDKARSRKLGGTGLGLSIVKHIVNLYRGEITVNSIKGKGTTFTVILPRDHEAT